MNDSLAYRRSLDCVHCGLCLPACPTYAELGSEPDSPRGRIYLMRALLEGRVDDPEAIRPHLDRCLDCRACETACPSGVRYGQLLEGVRERYERQQPRTGTAARARRWLLRHLLVHQNRLRAAFALAALGQRLGLDALAGRLGLLPAGMRRIRPRIPSRRDRRPLRGSFHPRGRARARVALLTGCVMEPLFGDVNRSTVELLVHNGIAVEVPDMQVCCGALLVHDGLAADARRLAAHNVAAFAGFDFVVHNSAGCGAMMRDYGVLLESGDGRELAGRCRDICELLDELGLTAAPRPFPHRVAYDDPCHLTHAQGVTAAPRRLLAQVPGLQLVEHPDAERCCGSAGIYNLVQADLAARIGARKARALIASGAEVVVTGNPGCAMQIRAHLRDAGHALPVLHPVELLRPEPPPSP